MDVPIETSAPNHAVYFPHNVVMPHFEDQELNECLAWLHEHVGSNGRHWDWWCHENGTHTQVSFRDVDAAIQFKLTFI